MNRGLLAYPLLLILFCIAVKALITPNMDLWLGIILVSGAILAGSGLAWADEDCQPVRS